MSSATRGTTKGKSNFIMRPDWRRLTTLWSFAGVILAIVAISAVCLSNTSSSGDDALTSLDTSAVINGLDQPDSYLLFNQRWIEGLYTESLDLEDIGEVFWHVYSQLPDEVIVYPSENYYYFKMYVDKRQIWGNIRLPAGRRDMGVLSFAYFEYKESQFVTEPRIKKSKFYTVADGLLIDKVDDFTYIVRYNKKDVIFHLNKLPQDPPKLFELGEDEVFVMRTQDESGYQFFLIFNEKNNYLFWVLNEERYVPDILEPLADDLMVGRRSGFAFLVDSAHNDRKVLAAVFGNNATVNNYYDGPFDQLADNYVDETNISTYLQLAVPSLQGRIDKYGYYTDKDGSSRVAVSPYYVYFSEGDLAQFMERLRESEDPYYIISQRGRG